MSDSLLVRAKNKYTQKLEIIKIKSGLAEAYYKYDNYCKSRVYKKVELLRNGQLVTSYQQK